MAMRRLVMDSRVLTVAARWALLSLALASAPWAVSVEAADSPLPLKEEQQWGRSRSARPDQASSTPVSVGEPTPRLRFGADLVLGTNDIVISGSNSAGADGTHGQPGIGLSLRLGPQWTELLGTEIELTGLFGPLLLEGRVALLVVFTPPDWLFSLGIGPAAGAEAVATGGINIFGPPSWGYSGNYAGGEARIDFLPGAGPVTTFPRARRSLDIGVVAVIWAPTGGIPQGRTLLGWGLSLELGYLQF